MNESKTLCEYLWKLSYDQLPESTKEYTRLLIADYYASAAAGYQINAQFNGALQKVFQNMGGEQDSSVLFSGPRLPAPHAAFINAAFVHGADMDDGHKGAGGHPGGPVISAVMALAETLPVSGEDILLAIVCGYEAMIRIACAVQPDHVSRGFHSTGTTGAAGAAIGCAKLLKLPLDSFSNAFSLGLLQCSGLMMVTESGQAAKPINPGKAAYTGVLSARLAQAGIPAPEKPLESSKGFFKGFGDRIRPEAITDGLGKEFSVEGCYIKPYPCCRATHAGAESMKMLRERIPAPEDIERIELNIYPRAIYIAGDPRNHVPDCAQRAKFSLAFAIASILHTGDISVQELLHFDEIDAGIFETCRKTVLVPDPTTEDVANGRRGCRLKVILQDGTVLEQEIVIPKGDPERPMTMDDVTNKLRSCADGVLSPEAQEKLIWLIAHFDSMSDVKDLIDAAY